MTYPHGAHPQGSPLGNPGPGYQPAQPAAPYGAMPSAPAFGPPAGSANRVPFYLSITVMVFGFATYLASFGPVLISVDGELIGMKGHAGLAVPLAVLAGLLAAAGLLPKARDYTAIVAVIATLGGLLAIARTINKEGFYTVGWALWLIVLFNIVQAVAAGYALLLESGVITARPAQPRYGQYAPYGLPSGGGGYGYPGDYPSSRGGGAPYSPYSSYSGFPPGPGGTGQSMPSSAGYGGPAQPAPPTPPTGFPNAATPPRTAGHASGSGSGNGPGGSGTSGTAGGTGTSSTSGGSQSAGPAES